MLSFVNKRLETGIVCFAVYPRGGDACVSGDTTSTQPRYTLFPVYIRESRNILDTRGVFREIKRMRV